MIKRIQQLPQAQRTLIFVLLASGVVMLFLVLAVYIIIQTATAVPRNEAVALSEDIEVSEFVTLPDEDAYPASMALSPGGDLYIGSYKTGLIWQVNPDGHITALEGSKEAIGAVASLTFGPDGTLYILDRIDALKAEGAIVWAYKNGQLEQIISLSKDGKDRIVLPHDIVSDGQGQLYVSDFGPDRIWRIDPVQKSAAIWWESEADRDESQFALTGLWFEADENQLYMLDSNQDSISRVAIDAENPAAETEVIYRYQAVVGKPAPGFNQLWITDSGQIFLAALNSNEVYVLEDGQMKALAGSFRGASDVVYDASRQRLYVSNWDQRTLVPLSILVFQVSNMARLPFGIDVIDFKAAS